MRYAVLLPLALLASASGCGSLSRGVVAVEYRPGMTPTTTVAKCDATYTLCSPEEIDAKLEVRVAKGASVGFQYEANGALVAIAGDKVIPVDGCNMVWKCTPTQIARCDRCSVGRAMEETGNNPFLVPLAIFFRYAIDGQLWP
jgi:hypothetical protein